MYDAMLIYSIYNPENMGLIRDTPYNVIKFITSLINKVNIYGT
ncbi:hypothetical protein GNP75_02690 [Aliivibrio fischeri]|nr:hypothetical protein [Aliivibrio fischeri]MUJ27733.1 hypothetical protein [Aliivibrio fischeri]MUK26890.1 hypothetical protein [Aliivibrio fischeri]MUK32712.1 hypothetical protein [Aliivibrio fischeri]